MAKVYAFIDGFNFYHAINDRPYKRFKWMSLTKLVKCYVMGTDTLEGVEYFTTLATWDAGKVARHSQFIRANEEQGVVVTYGEFKRKDRYCTLCNRRFISREEKQTDVNIALRLLELAVQDRYDKAIIVSGDTDLIPAIKAVHRTFPQKKMGVVIPIGRASEDFKQNADFHHKMKIRHLISSRFDDNHQMSDGSIMPCPTAWR
ncbi:MAG TPA: NYN domain-containing protein [Terriglobales bacterium]|jgi:uncharacterized LabA/DUF88 family protein